MAGSFPPPPLTPSHHPTTPRLFTWAKDPSTEMRRWRKRRRKTALGTGGTPIVQLLILERKALKVERVERH